MSAPARIFLKSVNWIGDAILTTPAIRLLRREFPLAHITLAARPRIAELFRHNPDVDELWLEDASANGRGAGRTLIERIRAAGFDTGVAFPNSFGAAWLMYRGGIPRRIGYARDLRGPLLTDRLRADRAILRRHEVEYYLRLLEPLLTVPEAERRLVLEVDPQARRFVEQYLAQQGVAPGERLLGLNPGAFYGTAKRWAPERFARAAERLAARTGWRVVALGEARERDTGAEIARVCRVPVVLTQGELDLQQAVALIDRLTLLITNDSGAMHLAAARGVPLVAVFGSTDWRTTAPYHPNARIVRKETQCAPCLLRECPIDHRCMERVTVEDVVAAAEALLTVGN